MDLEFQPKSPESPSSVSVTNDDDDDIDTGTESNDQVVREKRAAAAAAVNPTIDTVTAMSATAMSDAVDFDVKLMATITNNDLETAAKELSPPKNLRGAETATTPLPSKPLRKLSMLVQNTKILGSGGGVGASSNAKKRKLPAITVNLMNFMSVVHMAFTDSVYDGNNIVVPDNFLLYYTRAGILEVDELDRKRARTGPSEIANQTDKSRDAEKRRFSKKLYLEIIMQLVRDLEVRGAIFQFSREALKYFLATYERSVSHNNFFDTNHLSKGEKSKNKTHQLPPGAILMEYVKGPDIFSNALHRSHKDDVKALKFIIDNNISIAVDIYTVMRHPKRHQTQYQETQDCNLSLSEYAKIPIPNSTFKRAQIAVSRHLILMLDNNQFVINSTAEKDFSQILSESHKHLSVGEYLVFDVSIGVKIKIIDLVGMVFGGKTLSNSYNDRIAFVNSLYPNAKVLKLSGDAPNSNYLFKPLSGFGVSYIKLKPLLTAAIIGISEKFACAALTTDEGDHELTVIAKFGLSGSATCMITTAEFKNSSVEENPPTIRVNDTKYSIVGDLDGVMLLERAVLVEIKDAHKFGGISTRPISSREEYKQMYQVPKDVRSNDAIVEMVNDPSRTEELVEILTNSVNFERLRSLIDCKTSFDVSY